MIQYSGKGVWGGIAIGRIHLVEKGIQLVERRRTEDSSGEIRRFETARAEAQEQLAGLYERAVAETGKESAAIFAAHQIMLEDADYLDFVKKTITQQQVNAEYAVSVTAVHFEEMFSAMEDAYMRERAADVRDISRRVTGILTNAEKTNAEKAIMKEPVIILAEDLTPSETLQLDKSLILSFVTLRGSANSHTAILARTMNIPALVGVDMALSGELEGRMAVVDSRDGSLYIDPDEDFLRRMKRRRDSELEERKLLRELKGQESITKDGRRVSVCANIGNVSDLPCALENDAEGIGLFRSEFIYLERSAWPTEEEQFRIYREAARAMSGKRVIIRTLDIGADKQADYFGLEREENPAMGLRAIRICLARPEIFKTQLRAIYRASKYGRLAVMYPMITSLEEVRRIRQISEEVRAELDRENIPYDRIEEGIMVETPAAAMISDRLAGEVNFFSIGTNDLSQYTMAIDRQNQKLDKFFNPHHEAVLRMIGMVCRNAHAGGIWVGICGELGADLELTEAFLRMGVDEFSVPPSCVLPLRKRIQSLDLSMEV